MRNQAKFVRWRPWVTGRITSRIARAECSLSLMRTLGHRVTEVQTNGENGVDCGQRDGMMWAWTGTMQAKEREWENISYMGIMETTTKPRSSRQTGSC